jgi:glycosyltransferase involved in cell wall biosynthesis
MSIAPVLMALSLYCVFRKLKRGLSDFDVIDAHYFYPDGVAAVILGLWLNKPVVVTARGTDINLIPKYALPRMWILWAASRCAKIISVSDALRNRILELGVDADKVSTLRNGVDLGFFRPESDRSLLRKKLQIRGFTLLSGGHLIESKGHHLVIRSLDFLANVSLIIIGSGRMRGELESLASETGVAHRGRFIGAVSQDELRRYYNAADALVLASSREGMPNVLLESIACGTPVVATPYGGSPEVIINHHAGQLIENRSPDAIAEGVDALRKSYPDRADTRRHAEMFSWQATTDGQLKVFSRLLEGLA